jgi:hypothetical protein
MKNPFKFTRQDRRQGKREGVSIQQEFDICLQEFHDLLFSDECPDDIFEEYHLMWMEFAGAYNNKHSRVSIANPRGFHDYGISHSDHIYDPIHPAAPKYIKPFSL